MFGLVGWKLKLAGGLVIALLMASAVGYHYWKVGSLSAEVSDLKLNLQTSEENNSRLQVALEEQKASIQRIEEQRLKEAQAAGVLREQFKVAQGSVNKLKKLLSEHDLNYLSLRKPGLIETRVNRGTTNVGKKLEEITQ